MDLSLYNDEAQLKKKKTKSTSKRKRSTPSENGAKDSESEDVEGNYVFFS